MIRLSTKQFNTLKKLIKGTQGTVKCCNYDNGNCLLLDDECPQVKSPSLMCKYCKEVLLKDKDAELLNAELFPKETKGSKRKCGYCGKSFVGHGRAKYCCDNCKKKAHYKQQANYHRKSA